MLQLMEAWQQVLAFLDRGGPVLEWILLVIFVMWALIIERVIYLRAGHRQMADSILERWESRAERRSWHAHQIRQAMLAESQMALQRFQLVIKTLVALCPLLGLLGTVTGMIHVFDVMAVMGQGSPRAMASGISQATIPTMGGMVGALIGLLGMHLIKRASKLKQIHLEDQLTFDH
jgi:biopolymer transport protein ExbB